MRARSNHVVQLDHILGLHPHATVTNRQTNIPFLRRPMDINIASKRVLILQFESAQPDDPCYDWIAPGSIDGDNLTGPPAIFKNSASRHAVADFLRDLQFTQWRAIASSPVTNSVLGSRNRINRHQRFAIKQREFLIL